MSSTVSGRVFASAAMRVVEHAARVRVSRVGTAHQLHVVWWAVPTLRCRGTRAACPTYSCGLLVPARLALGEPGHGLVDHAGMIVTAEVRGYDLPGELHRQVDALFAQLLERRLRRQIDVADRSISLALGIF